MYASISSLSISFISSYSFITNFFLYSFMIISHINFILSFSVFFFPVSDSFYLLFSSCNFLTYLTLHDVGELIFVVIYSLPCSYTDYIVLPDTAPDSSTFGNRSEAEHKYQTRSITKQKQRSPKDNALQDFQSCLYFFLIQ